MDSPDRQRSLLAVHGAAILLLGLLSGLPAVSEELASVVPPTWRAAHGALLLAGVWLLATGALLPALILSPGHRKALVASLIVTGYAFSTAVLTQAITGVRSLAPHGTLSSWIAYAANLITAGAGVMAALLTLVGARNGLARPPSV